MIYFEHFIQLCVYQCTKCDDYQLQTVQNASHSCREATFPCPTRCRQDKTTCPASQRSGKLFPKHLPCGMPRWCAAFHTPSGMQAPPRLNETTKVQLSLGRNTLHLAAGAGNARNSFMQPHLRQEPKSVPGMSTMRCERCSNH